MLANSEFVALLKQANTDSSKMAEVSFDVLEEPRAEPSILMSQLPDALKERGLELSTDPALLFNNQTFI